VSSGDIGTTAADCEKSLAEILDLATHWKAVLLIDEADVFLEQRSTDHLARNGVVSGKNIHVYSDLMFCNDSPRISFLTTFGVF
jgi:hypothetical protein